MERITPALIAESENRMNAVEKAVIDDQKRQGYQRFLHRLEQVIRQNVIAYPHGGALMEMPDHDLAVMAGIGEAMARLLQEHAVDLLPFLLPSEGFVVLTEDRLKALCAAVPAQPAIAGLTWTADDMCNALKQEGAVLWHHAIWRRATVSP